MCSELRRRALRGKPITAASMTDRDHALGAIHLSEEGCERISAANLVSGLSHQCEPVAVVDLLPRPDLLGKS
jgi:hypothetical protein